MNRYSVARPIRNSRRLVQPVAFWSAFGLAVVAGGLGVAACMAGHEPTAMILFAAFGYLCSRSSS